MYSRVFLLALLSAFALLRSQADGKSADEWKSRIIYQVYNNSMLKLQCHVTSYYLYIFKLCKINCVHVYNICCTRYRRIIVASYIGRVLSTGGSRGEASPLKD